MTKGWIDHLGSEQLLTALVDPGAKINLIQQKFALQWDLRPVSAALPRPGFLDGEARYCYNAYDLEYHLVDSWGQHRKCTTLFYAVDYVGPDVILGMPMLSQEGITVDPQAGSWRYKIRTNKFEISGPEAFEEVLEGQPQVFALVCAGVTQAHVDKPERQVPNQIRHFKDQFDNDKAGILPEQGKGDHAIDLMEGKEPPFMPLYNLSQTELAELRRYIDDALAKGWIRHSVSPAGAPILFVPKKDGGLRLCVDYRGLNAVTVKNRHPLPLITETLDRLSGAKKFTKLDLKDAYHRIRIKRGDEWKTAFRTRYGHFEYQVLPFGLANAPATFQAYINQALRGLVDVICVVYLDDILIFSNEPAEHWRHVEMVLERLRAYGLYVNLKKCEFATKQVEFLGFIVSTDGVSMDTERVRTIEEWPQPRTYREVQVFLGFVNFYRRFVYHYSHIVAPLTGLLKGSSQGKKSGPFEWPLEAAQAFRQLKQIFTTTPLLHHYDPSKKVRVETDASVFGIAAILSQPDENGHWRPVAFWSRKLIPAEQNYETHDQELLAIVASFKQWRHYLEGSSHPIEVWSDHNNLRGFMGVKELNQRQARWAIKLAAYDFEIFHRPGSRNPADGPSRRPDYEGACPLNTKLLPTLQNKLALTAGDVALPESRREETSPDHTLASVRASATDESWGPSQGKREVLAGLAPVFRLAGIQVVIPRKTVNDIPEAAYKEPQRSMKSLLKDLQAEDSFAVRLCSNILAPTLSRRPKPSKVWSVDSEGLLRHEGRIYVPGDPATRQELISKNHDDPLAGHFGAERTLELLGRKYYWPACAAEVKDYVRTCDICQRTKVHRHQLYGQLSSLPIPKKPWKEVSMDFITGLPASKRRGVVYDSILVIVDRLTKMARYVPVTKKIDAAELADIFFDEVVLRYGMPDGIVSDRGSVFTSAFWSSLCFHARIRRRLSTAFHPQTDGATERQNQVLEHYLRCYADEEQSNWARLLPLAEFAYNNSHHSTAGSSPFYLLHGYHPEIRWEVEDNSLEGEVPSANERIKLLQARRDELAERLRQASASQAKYYNRKHTPKDYTVGQLVMLSTKNLKQKRPSKKMSHKFVGPFRIEDKVGAQAYRLTLPSTYRIHNTFHVSLLEPYYHRAGAEGAETFMQAPELIDDEEQWEIEEILDKTKSKGTYYYKVKWVGWGDPYNQWLPENELENAAELRKEFDDRAPAVSKRKRPGRPNFEEQSRKKQRRR